MSLADQSQTPRQHELQRPQVLYSQQNDVVGKTLTLCCSWCNFNDTFFQLLLNYIVALCKEFLIIRKFLGEILKMVNASLLVALSIVLSRFPRKAFIYQPSEDLLNCSRDLSQIGSVISPSLFSEPSTSGFANSVVNKRARHKLKMQKYCPGDLMVD